MIDAETILLDDNTEVRLIGALAPRHPDASGEASYWQPEREAQAELERVVLGRSVTLAFAGRRTDRYGRTLAHVLVEPTPQESEADPSAERIWVQGHMLSRGHARAYALKDNMGCLRELAAHQASARRAGLGLWSHAAYQPRSAARAWEISRLRSTFQVVEGEVTAVIVGRSVLILRFDRDAPLDRQAQADADDPKPPSRGFSVSVKPAIVRAWAEQGLTLADLEGRRMRIQGWIERRGGPSIEIVDPHQIELADDPVAPAQVTSSAGNDRQPTRRRSRKGTREAAALSQPVD